MVKVNSILTLKLRKNDVQKHPGHTVNVKIFSSRFPRPC